jgi:hypothetical protein
MAAAYGVYFHVSLQEPISAAFAVGINEILEMAAAAAELRVQGVK